MISDVSHGGLFFFHLGVSLLSFCQEISEPQEAIWMWLCANIKRLWLKTINPSNISEHCRFYQSCGLFGTASLCQLAEHLQKILGFHRPTPGLFHHGTRPHAPDNGNPECDQLGVHCGCHPDQSLSLACLLVPSFSMVFTVESFVVATQ